MNRKTIKAFIIPLALSIVVIFSKPCYSKTVSEIESTTMNALYSIKRINSINESIVKEKQKKYIDGWTTTSVNVRELPSTESDILDTYLFNAKVSVTDYDDEWYEIKYEDGIAYMYKDYISDTENKYIDYAVPSNSGFKSYMPYKAITSTSSKQYILQHTKAYTGTYGIRQINGRYCVAIGSYFTSEMGTMFDLILENGTVIPCVLADQKADKDTDKQNIVTRKSGCLSEFIVDTDYLSKNAKLHGDISYCNEKWNSPVKTIRVYE